MSVHFDLYNRHYRLRPILYTVILSRLIKFFSRLRELYKELSDHSKYIQEHLHAKANPKTELFIDNVEDFFQKMRLAFHLLRLLSIDLNTLISRSDRKIQQYYTHLDKDLQEVITQEKGDTPKITQNVEEAKLLKKALKDEKAVHKYSEKDAYLADYYKKSVSHMNHFHHQIKSLCQESYLQAKYLMRGHMNPLESFNDIDFHKTTKLLRLEIVKTVELDAIKNKKKILYKKIRGKEIELLEQKNHLLSDLDELFGKKVRDIKSLQHRFQLIFKQFEELFDEVLAVLPDEHMPKHIQHIKHQAKNKSNKLMRFVFKQYEKFRRIG